MQPTRVRGFLQVLLGAALLLGAVVVRVVMSAATELESADRAAAAGDIEGAIVHYRRAARWYAPGSPLHVEALGKLGAIGAEAEKRNDSELALSAYRAIRAAIMSARSFYVPERARLDAANRRIAALMAELPAPPMDTGKSKEQLRREHMALLRKEPGPDVFWTLVLLLGFCAWVLGAFVFTQRAIDEQDRFVPREAARWGVLIAVGFGLFVLGMSLA